MTEPRSRPSKGAGTPGRPLRIVVAHNAYLQRGGEDAVVDAEVALLRQHGHEVFEYRRDNVDIAVRSKAQVALDTIWSQETVREIDRIFATFRPDLLHVHNTLPLISPSVYWAAARARVPVVQTLHNFRLLCPQGLLLRDGRVCEDCVGNVPWRAVLHRCYRKSAVQSAVVSAMVGIHDAMGTWHHKVTRFIALNEFCRQTFIRGGLPADKVVLKPNFFDPPARPDTAPIQRRGFLYVGRLSVEKGISTLAAAMSLTPGASLRVAGTGPEQHLLEGVPGVELLGPLSEEDVNREMRSARALVLPSVWFENFPRTLVEAYAGGLPVIASRIGALETLVTENETGLLFSPGNAAELAQKLRWALGHSVEMDCMGIRAQEFHSNTLTGAINYELITKIYSDAVMAAQRT